MVVFYAILIVAGAIVAVWLLGHVGRGVLEVMHRVDWKGVGISLLILLLVLIVALIIAAQR